MAMSRFVEEFKKIVTLHKEIYSIKKQQTEFNRELVDQKLLLGRMLANQLKLKNDIENIQDAEFKVYSQWGDDGIIQYLVHKLDIKKRVFIEFGVENYIESNTRFLLMNDNWSGLVMDASEENINYIKNDEIYWKYDLTAKCAFIDVENINSLIAGAGFSGEVGILSIDIDGNDYWIWKAVNLVSPIIVIVEYNSVFGNKRSITVPYNKHFSRTKEHHSNLYFGASLPALCHLAKAKGYSFVGSDSRGVNAYFVRNDMATCLKTMDADTGYVQSKFRQSRDREGKLDYISYHEQLSLIAGLDVFNVLTAELEKL
jgi:hypothetical protein